MATRSMIIPKEFEAAVRPWPPRPAGLSETAIQRPMAILSNPAPPPRGSCPKQEFRGFQPAPPRASQAASRAGASRIAASGPQ